MEVNKHFMARNHITWSVVTGKVTLVQQYSRFIWDRILMCSTGKPSDYQRLMSLDHFSDQRHDDELPMSSAYYRYDSDCDFISVKIIVLGDCKIGKTSFVVSTC